MERIYGDSYYKSPRYIDSGVRVESLHAFCLLADGGGGSVAGEKVREEGRKLGSRVRVLCRLMCDVLLSCEFSDS